MSSPPGAQPWTTPGVCDGAVPCSGTPNPPEHTETFPSSRSAPAAHPRDAGAAERESSQPLQLWKVSLRLSNGVFILIPTDDRSGADPPVPQSAFPRLGSCCLHQAQRPLQPTGMVPTPWELHLPELPQKILPSPSPG